MNPAGAALALAGLLALAACASPSATPTRAGSASKDSASAPVSDQPSQGADRQGAVADSAISSLTRDGAVRGAIVGGMIGAAVRPDRPPTDLTEKPEREKTPKPAQAQAPSWQAALVPPPEPAAPRPTPAPDSQHVAMAPLPLPEPPDRSCAATLAGALDLYQDARRSAHGTAPESAYSRAAGALEEALARCAAERPDNWRAAALALANAHYLSRAYPAAAVWYREAVRQRPSGTDDDRPAQMAEILAACAYDAESLDLMRQGSLRLVGNPDKAARRKALLLFERLRAATSCSPLRAAAAQSISTLRRELGMGSGL